MKHFIHYSFNKTFNIGCINLDWGNSDIWSKEMMKKILNIHQGRVFWAHVYFNIVVLADAFALSTWFLKSKDKKNSQNPKWMNVMCVHVLTWKVNDNAHFHVSLLEVSVFVDCNFMLKVHTCFLPCFETCAIFWKYLQNIWVGGNGFCQKHKLPLQKLAGAHHIHFSIYLYFLAAKGAALEASICGWCSSQSWNCPFTF